MRLGIKSFWRGSRFLTLACFLLTLLITGAMVVWLRSFKAADRFSFSRGDTTYSTDISSGTLCLSSTWDNGFAVSMGWDHVSLAPSEYPLPSKGTPGFQWGFPGIGYMSLTSRHPSTGATAGAGFLVMRVWLIVAFLMLAFFPMLRSLIKRAEAISSQCCPKCGYDWRASVDRCSECGFVKNSQST
jgi:hypothetical protein